MRGVLETEMVGNERSGASSGMVERGLNKSGVLTMVGWKQGLLSLTGFKRGDVTRRELLEEYLVGYL